MHDEHRDDPALAFALSRLVVVADDAHADRRVPRRSRGPTYEAEVQRQLVGAVGAPGPRRPRQAASAPAPPGKSTSRRSPVRSVVEAAEHHAGARLGREERRLLRHAQVGGRRGADRVDGRPAAAAPRRRRRPSSTCGGDGRARRCGRRAATPGTAGSTPASKRAESTSRSAAGSSADARVERRRSGASSARPSRVDEAERRRSRASRPRARRRRRASFGAGGAHRRTAGASACAQVDAADAVQQPVDGAHAELLGGELDDEGHDRVGAGIVDAAARRSAR